MLQTSDLGKDMLKTVYMQMTDKKLSPIVSDRQLVGKRYLVVPARDVTEKGNNEGGKKQQHLKANTPTPCEQ